MKEWFQKGVLTPNSLSQLNLGSVHLVKIQASSKCIKYCIIQVNPFSHLSRGTRRTRLYICPSQSGQRTSAENKNIVSAGPSQSGRPSCINTMVARICRPHVGRLLHKQCVGRCDLVIGPADIFSHKRDLFFVNHACG
jgi:hypothetical protein